MSATSRQEMALTSERDFLSLMGTVPGVDMRAPCGFAILQGATRWQ
jgi:hypothetical protein